MRSRLAVLIACSTVGLWLGCNAILGNESAVFVPDADGPDSNVDDTDVRTEDRFAPDAVSDAEVDAGPCKDLVSNPKHCGACNHDCLGGACAAGVCQPVLLTSDNGTPEAIAISTTHVYWNNQATGDIRRVAIAGGTSELVFDGPSGTLPGTGIAVVGDEVYFPQDDKIVKCPGTGCGGQPTPVVVGLTEVSFVGGSGDMLVFAEGRVGGRVGRCKLPCTSYDAISNEPFPMRVALSGDTLAWSTLTPTPGDVRASLALGSATTLAKGVYAYGVAIVGSNVVYASRSDGLSLVQLDGGGRRRLGSVTDTEFLATDGTTIFYTESKPIGAVLRCDVTGCRDAGTVLAKNQVTPRGVAFDAKSVYWVNQGNAIGGDVWRVAR